MGHRLWFNMYFRAKGLVYVIPEPHNSFLSSHYSLQYAIKLSVQTQGEIIKEPNRLKSNLYYFSFFFFQSISFPVDSVHSYSNTCLKTNEWAAARVDLSSEWWDSLGT